MIFRNIIGLRLACTDYQGAMDWIFEKMRVCDRAYAVEAANTHVATLARHEKNFGKTMARFDLIVPDGMPLVWSLNHLLPRESALQNRVYGPTLMLKTFAAAEPDARHFFLGGSPETLTKLEKNLSTAHPKSVIAGSYSPPFGDWSADEFERICSKIKDSRANLIWVGLGCPKQEEWIAKHLDDLPAGVYFGVGAAFAFHAGEVRQAPALVQKFGMEWLFRLCMEPRRLWRRYLRHNSLFIFYTLKDLWSPKRHPETSES